VWRAVWGDSRVVIVAGIAEAFAGALSIGAGEFISGRAEAQVQQREILRELDEMRTAPYFFFAVPVALPVSLVLTCAALVLVGIIKGKLASMDLVRSVVEIVVVGALSAGGGYLLGSVLPHLFGF